MPEPLTEHAIALSISESDDMAALGLAKEHLDDAMAEIARHLLALGARLLYGGDLRPGGFTEVLFELVARYRRDAGEADVRPGVTNFVAWPVHLGMTAEDIAALSGGLEGAAALVLLDLAGEPITMEQRRALATHGASEEEWAAGLSAMRRSVTGLCHGRVVLGGRGSIARAAGEPAALRVGRVRRVRARHRRLPGPLPRPSAAGVARAGRVCACRAGPQKRTDP